MNSYVDTDLSGKLSACHAVGFLSSSNIAPEGKYDIVDDRVDGARLRL